jgi:hypothetical protein
MLEEDECVEAPQSYGVDMEEVAGDDVVGLRGKELPPGRALAAWCGVDARGVEDVPDGGGGDRVAEPREFALDPAVSPAAVLPGQA